ncbi:uncharacterized protein LOC133707251 isoform X1 [Rosa rugosa]|uniref:uncharacterized protein LOC133707251 isoform X1 n=2 Tax=Rosa rugosa TaxID=74645 RepID=UPI002B40F6FC|nr:uncharacterized protein LOC133707251 isoform X1 [Rosa rugosa]
MVMWLPFICRLISSQSSSVASSTTSFGSSKKMVWVWTESKQVMTTAVERGWNTFLFQSQKLADDWSCELMKFEYQKKVASLSKLKKCSTNSEALEKSRAAVSHLHIRYIVDMQSMDPTVSKINSFTFSLLQGLGISSEMLPKESLSDQAWNTKQ